ncbi:hypothetical protein [Mycobacterium sp.]|jgi:hypothetical protein|nr:hypothetical protein [Mycobacterium sp.]HME47593.1 hypothetical protein [Mycobacterium sp.]
MDGIDSIDIGLLREQLERIANALEVLCDIQDPDERYHHIDQRPARP